MGNCVEKLLRQLDSDILRDKTTNEAEVKTIFFHLNEDLITKNGVDPDFEVLKEKENFDVKMQTNNEILTISEKNSLENDAFFESIIKIQSKFTTIRITVNLPSQIQQDRLKLIFQKFGLTVERLLWEKCIFDLAEYASFLNLLPNLKELVLRKWHLKAGMTQSKTFNLQRLEKIVVIDCDFGFELVLQKIPRNTLREVVFDQNRFRNLNDFFEQQKNIKKFKCDQKFTLSDQKLTHLVFKPWNSDEINEMLQNQHELTFLKVQMCCGMIENEFRMTKIFVDACGLRNLTVLMIDIEFVAADRIEMLAGLQKLEKLELSGDGSEIQEEMEEKVMEKLKIFSKLRFPRLTKLSLLFPNLFIQDDFFRSLGRRESLQDLKISSKFVNINFVLASFPEISSLSVNYTLNNAYLNHFYTHDYEELHSSLRKLEIKFTGGEAESYYSPMVLLQFLQSLPSLQTLEITADLKLTRGFFELILKKLPRLTSFAFSHTSITKKSSLKIDSEFIDFITRQKYLKIFKIDDHFRDFSYKIKDAIFIFQQHFEVVSCNQNSINLQRHAEIDVKITKDHFC